MIAVMTKISRDDYPSATRYILRAGGYLVVMADTVEVALYAQGKWIAAFSTDKISTNRV